MYLFAVIILGIIFRLAYIIKPEGLWNDEYVSWSIASTSFNEGFVDGILKQCHMPLYYLYLKIFTLISNSDTFLRLSSVIPSIIAIYVMYKVGKTQNDFTARTLALLTSVSAFLIYYAQELRFYSLLYLFSAIMLLFLIKSVNSPDKKNLTGFTISSLLVLFTHTIGFVFVFFSVLYLILAIKPKKIYYYIFPGLFIPTMPLVIYIFLHTGHSQWWGAFSYRSIVFMLTDFFSPILTNNVNIPSVVFYNKGIFFAFTLITPAIISTGFILYAIIKEKSLRGLFYITLCTTIILSIAALTSKFVFITKYNIEILPILMLLFATGLSKTKNITKYAFLVLYLAFQILYFFTPYYPSKQPRAEGNRIPAMLIAHSGIKPNDKLIITYYNPDRFKKYINLNGLEVTSIDKTNVANYVSASGKIEPSVYLRNREFTQKKLNNLINCEQKTFVLFLDSVAFFSDKDLRQIGTKQEYINKVNPIYLEMSVLRNEILSYGKKNNLDVKSTKVGSWSLVRLSHRTEEGN